MIKRLKKFIIVLSFAFVLLSTGNARATGVIQDVKERHNIASGVEYVKIDRFTESGWIDIDVLKLDAKNTFSNLTPLVGPEGVSKRATLTTMIESNDAVAGINGDFFEVTNFPMALGSLTGEDKVILTTPEAAFSRNSFYVTKDGKGGVGSLDNNITVTSKGQNFYVNALNKVSRPYKSLSVLDSNWGKTSPGRKLGANNVEILVGSNGRVLEKRVGGLPISILPGSYVLTQVGENLKSFNIGDQVSINYGSYKDLMFSIGGGNILVNKGSIPKSGLSTSRAPRTAIGINKNNTEILMVTIDGRNNASIGMGERELAEFMKSIGAYNSLNLDGGGSTTMGIKYSGDKNTTVVNTPSDGSQRPIVSGVGIKTNAPVTEPSYIKIIPSEKSMFSGFSYPFELEVYDKHHNKLSVDKSQIKVESGFGTISNNYFTPNKKGKGTIVATYKNAKGSVDVFLHSDIKELVLDVDSLQMTEGKVHIFKTIYGKDDLGYRKKINPSQVSFSISEGLGSLEGNKFTAGSGSNTGIITATYKDIKRVIPVSLGSQKENIFGFDSEENLFTTTKPNDDTKITTKAFIDSENQDSNPSTGLIYSLANYEKNQSAEINYKGGIKLGAAQYIGLWIKGDNQGGKITATFRDGNSKIATADLVNNVNFNEWKYVEAFVPSSLSGEIYLDKISVTISEAKQIVSTIKFDGLVAAVKLPLNWELATGSSRVNDPRNYQMANEEAANFSITSFNKNGDNTKNIAHLNNKDVAIAFNGVGGDLMKQINASMKFNGNDTHNIKTSNKSAFITLQSNQYGVRSANPNQWKPFINTIENKDLKNIVIMMQSNPNNISGEKEKGFFFDTIEKAVQSGKNVFIIIPGSTNSVNLVDGYRLVTLTGSSNAALDISVINNNLSYVLTRY